MTTPAALAALHRRAYSRLRPWSEVDFAGLLQSPHVFLVALPQAFALGRAVADEAELLTIATDPDHRRQGLARTCLLEFEAAARTRGATRALLEVDSENPAAVALYTSAGYERIAMRRAYYALRHGTRAHALIMAKPLG